MATERPIVIKIIAFSSLHYNHMRRTHNSQREAGEQPSINNASQTTIIYLSLSIHGHRLGYKYSIASSAAFVFVQQTEIEFLNSFVLRSFMESSGK